ncbi:hydroxymethylglutaryl-CoA lyase [Legionella sp. W05-934-2]|jgi:hydroxymethylglutaryl-CoA lyase|uniref:hydroxymethylglutaryl-CoA lyase n=1 Tax=Legionella sp. W05-934-2 TaxID=1198649 RepID=UPI003461DEC2
MSMDNQVRIVEVGPRDGLQNEPTFVETSVKIELVNRLTNSGLNDIEVGSFVSPKAIPQLADSREVIAGIQQPKKNRYWALVPNEKGMLNAIEAGVKYIAVFAAASETFSQRNINCSIEESIERFIPVADMAKKHNISMRGYVSCVLGCPYEGNISPDKVLFVSEKLKALGVSEISLGDTIGVGTAKQTKHLLQVMLQSISATELAMHFHDTYGQAVSNINSSLEMGIRCFDSAVAGLGGCPYARGASGNVATEDVLYFMHGSGMETGVDIYKVVEAGDWLCRTINRANQSKVAKALIGNDSRC